MACYSPIKGWRSQVPNRFGNYPLVFKGSYQTHQPLTVPCGNCIGCRKRRSGEWAVRGTHEAQLYDHSIFITLTFRPADLPADNGLHYEYFQLFMMRIREKYGSGIRYIVCGEYGEQRGRPHFHAILFNFDFPDKRRWYTSAQGHVVYRSPSLEELWPFGNSEIGSVTPASIAYVARYVMKKVTGNHADVAYDWMNPETGEVFSREPEFAHYSLKPGIGHDWLVKYVASVYPHDYIIFNGMRVRPPRYYDKLYQKWTGICIERVADDGSDDISKVYSSEEFDAIKLTREESMKIFLDDNTDDRLRVREQVALAQLNLLKRKLT